MMTLDGCLWWSVGVCGVGCSDLVCCVAGWEMRVVGGWRPAIFVFTTFDPTVRSNPTANPTDPQRVEDPRFYNPLSIASYFDV